ncbi:MAG: outer membrane lipoprotein-sorting protein [Brevinematia bacterium]
MNLKRIAILILFPYLCYPLEKEGANITTQEILKNVEDHLITESDFEITISVESYKNNKIGEVIVMKGIVERGKITSLSYIEPKNMKGKKIVIKGNEMWVIVPNTKNPIPISPSQRLMGGISFGDINRLTYSDDYNPRLAGIESVDGKSADGETITILDCYRLELTAKKEGLSYNKIVMWVDPVDFLPVKSEFFSLSGKKMMKAYYTATEEWLGKLTFTEIYLYDMVNTSISSKVKYSDLKIISSNETSGD